MMQFWVIVDAEERTSTLLLYATDIEITLITKVQIESGDVKYLFWKSMFRESNSSSKLAAMES